MNENSAISRHFWNSKNQLTFRFALVVPKTLKNPSRRPWVEPERALFNFLQPLRILSSLKYHRKEQFEYSIILKSISITLHDNDKHR